MKTLKLALTLYLFFALSCQAEESNKFRISLDTAPNHLRNKTISRYAQLLEQRLGKNWHIEVYPSGQLYKDRDVPKALYWGNIEMGLVSVTGLARYEPNIGLFVSPALYGLNREQSYALTGSAVGRKIIRHLEERLQVHVLGDNLDLGFLHTFSTSKGLFSSDDLIGRKIRVPGAAIQMARFKLQQANPIAIPWSDVPLALAQNGIDGLMSSYETVRSGKLWDAGVKHVYEDKGVFVQYVPMLSKKFWESLTEEQQNIFQGSWRDVVTDARDYAFRRQLEAKAELISHGILVTTPSDSELKEQRKKFTSALKDLGKSFRLAPDLVQGVSNYVQQLDTITINTQQDSKTP